MQMERLVLDDNKRSGKINLETEHAKQNKTEKNKQTESNATQHKYYFANVEALKKCAL